MDTKASGDKNPPACFHSIDKRSSYVCPDVADVSAS